MNQVATMNHFISSKIHYDRFEVPFNYHSMSFASIFPFGELPYRKWNKSIGKIDKEQTYLALLYFIITYFQ